MNDLDLLIPLDWTYSLLISIPDHQLCIQIIPWIAYSHLPNTSHIKLEHTLAYLTTLFYKENNLPLYHILKIIP